MKMRMMHRQPKSSHGKSRGRELRYLLVSTGNLKEIVTQISLQVSLPSEAPVGNGSIHIHSVPKVFTGPVAYNKTW